MTVHLNDLDKNLNRSSAPLGPVAVQSRPGLYRNGIKRALDVTVVVISSIVVVPVVLVLALLVCLDGRFPFYWNPRVGRGGRDFRMLKLRTMVPNADRQLERHLAANPAARAEWEATQKLKCDPRITFVGRYLRKMSLDELPQMWNVLTGEMSLVGPRPMMPSQRELYPGTAYYSLRPGITGPWQVSDRNEVSFAQRADFDRQYELDVSFKTDVQLLLATARAVVKATGY